MVVVPYSDRLVLMGKYLQQLIMESLGKELDLDGKVVHQGLTVYGNKGGTDAHAYIQQLNDGCDDFFVTFIEPLKDAQHVDIGGGLTMGDYLHGFKEGLVNALRGKGRQVIEITIEDVNARSVGMLIALYERAVAFYAELIHINAFHQPGVQAYKLASKHVNDINLKLQNWIAKNKGEMTAQAIAEAAGLADAAREVSGLLAKFAANEREFEGHGVKREFRDGDWIYVVG
jgi:glucose-6-phosphate isomerase